MVDKNGLATVIGDGPAYFVLADHFARGLPGQEAADLLELQDLAPLPGRTFDLREPADDRHYPISVTDGVLSGNPY